jgi:hypothetical protein
MIPIIVPDKELYDMYYLANNITEGKNPPISTKMIYAAMRYAIRHGIKLAQMKEENGTITH